MWKNMFKNIFVKLNKIFTLIYYLIWKISLELRKIINKNTWSQCAYISLNVHNINTYKISVYDIEGINKKDSPDDAAVVVACTTCAAAWRTAIA